MRAAARAVYGPDRRLPKSAPPSPGRAPRRGGAAGEARGEAGGAAAPPLVRVFKGGGYVAADLEASLRNAGLERAVRLQRTILGAHCVLAMARRAPGHGVADLRQVRVSFEGQMGAGSAPQSS